MFTSNPFAALAQSVAPGVLQAYLALMTLAVVAGTLFDVHHKGSGKFFAARRQAARTRAERELSGAQTIALAVATLAEAAVSGEFCKWPRRASHLLMMYGFFAYLASTLLLICAYPTAHPALWSALWTLGCCMILVGGLWFFFFLRVNVAYDGAAPFHLGYADLFVGSLLLSVASGLAWHLLQLALGLTLATWVAFGSYVFFTTLLFVSVPWSKFAHMFFKPAVAFQRRVEEANGASDLPRPTRENFIVRS
jgi:hypothetical protein